MKKRSNGDGRKPSSAAPERKIPPIMPPGFLLKDTGVYKLKRIQHEEPREIWICSRLEVLAHTRSPENEEWGKLLHFTDREGHPHEWLLPVSMLAKDPGAVCGRLLDMGLRISPNKDVPNELRRYIQMAEPTIFVRIVQRIGWYQDAFVLPDEVIGPSSSETIRLRAAIDQGHLFKTAGSLDDWKKNVAYYCQENSLLAFAVSCAFAAPLLPFIGDLGGGFHLFGTSSIGKTTMLLTGGSVWGGGGRLGNVQSWSTTANALENTAEGHNHCLLCLDELKLIPPEQASTVAYTLSNGQRKTRQSKEGHTQRKAEWQLLFLSTGEITLPAHLDDAQRRLYAGQAVRFCDIPARVSEDYGGFETLHNFDSPQKLAKHLAQASEKYYGTPAREFLRKLTQYDRSTIVDTLKRMTSDFRKKYAPKVSAEVARAADRFALVAAGGELATQFGVTCWIKGTAEGSVAKCFASWRRNRGTDGNWDDDAMLRHLRHALITDGSSRFQRIENGKETHSGDHVYKRLGWVTSITHTDVTGKKRDGGFEYILTEETFEEMCKPYSADECSRVLRQKNALVFEGNGRRARRTVPGFKGRPGFIVINTASIMPQGPIDDDNPRLDFDGKSGDSEVRQKQVTEVTDELLDEIIN